MPRHPKFYMRDGTLVLKAGDGSEVLYRVYRAVLENQSVFFEGLLSLPNSKVDSLAGDGKKWLEEVRAAGVDGTTDETALVLPAQLATKELDAFFDLMFYGSWMDAQPATVDACAILKISHFLVVDRGIRFAKRHLDKEDALPAVQRLSLGFSYGFGDWVRMAFDELMSVPINELTPEEEETMGWKAYRALARAQAEVLDVRLRLAVARIPVVNHVNWCYNHTWCQAEWTKMWTSMSGVLGALIKEDAPGAQILENLATYDRGGTTEECFRRTCEGLQDTPEKVSILKEEEGVVDREVEKLLQALGIPSKWT
ncbi:hypothetical protein FB45DRAFT_1017156 [Roridomyces roridus]|uniref:BTB domain-containing protein n=1 Tax=Roridomyces roridus TaxID=1738132 RepID=A0AAD7FY80_9AGAR|nr:hypothetical protein FB45DRAFT_1017156 [Roridomyces roridus]